MSQITLYVDEETERRMKEAARAAGMSISRWVVELIRARTTTDWPDSVRRLAGAWADLPEAELLRSTEGRDTPREPL